ncbi:uncharacterized protein si:dkey-10o6.2 [Astyanax mexicanus]|uniref:Si:dkey-10o6.2 n=1 Tax=Astyanax mexicanus TaxID=7994 RepID=W5LQA1_ASTMX|nr:uncharacterized protein si:dkey-10o6.2 [Astyanax mexicanus]
MDTIPVVDFNAYNLGVNNVPDNKLVKLGEEIKAAFTGVGFVYLRNSGIEDNEVTNVMSITEKFFLLPEEKKRPFSRGTFPNGNHGWISLEQESLNPRCPGDLKEAFNVTSLSAKEWPTEGVDGFHGIQEKFFLRCKELSLRVLRVMAIGLGLDPSVFIKAHKLIGSDENDSTLRSLYYPLVKSDNVKKDQIRCGEHSDYGSITLVFQSPQAGLQVRNRNKEFILAPYIPGTVLVNIADLMQRWTSDVFVSAVHRVLLPPPGDSGIRQSLVFFVQPDNEAMITCCDGSNKYPPVNALDYLLERFRDSYGKK